MRMTAVPGLVRPGTARPPPAPIARGTGEPHDPVGPHALPATRPGTTVTAPVASRQPGADRYWCRTWSHLRQLGQALRTLRPQKTETHGCAWAMHGMRRPTLITSLPATAGGGYIARMQSSHTSRSQPSSRYCCSNARKLRTTSGLSSWIMATPSRPVCLRSRPASLFSVQRRRRHPMTRPLSMPNSSRCLRIWSGRRPSGNRQQSTSVMGSRGVSVGVRPPPRIATAVTVCSRVNGLP